MPVATDRGNADRRPLKWWEQEVRGRGALPQPLGQGSAGSGPTPRLQSRQNACGSIRRLTGPDRQADDQDFALLDSFRDFMSA